MTQTPNSSDLSRDADVMASADSLAEALRAIITDNPPAPVRLMLTNDGLSVWTYDNAKTLQVLVDDRVVKGLKVKQNCVLLVEPKAFSELLTAKFAGQNVRIQTSANKPIKVMTKAGGQAIYHAADEDECHTVPDHWRLKTDDSGIYSFPMFDNEQSSLVVKVSRSELQRGLVDMQVAKAPYVVFKFDKKSTCSSGHWGAKSNQSTSPIQADIINGSGEVCFTSNLGTILNALLGDEILIQKNDKGTFVILDGQTTSVVATEAIREA